MSLKDTIADRERNKRKKSPAWTRKEGKSPTGGLNAKGRASYTKGTLKAPQPEGHCHLKNGNVKCQHLSYNAIVYKTSF